MPKAFKNYFHMKEKEYEMLFHIHHPTHHHIKLFRIGSVFLILFSRSLDNQHMIFK